MEDYMELSKILFGIVVESKLNFENAMKAISNTLLCIADGFEVTDEGFKKLMQTLMIAYRERTIKEVDK